MSSCSGGWFDASKVLEFTRDHIRHRKAIWDKFVEDGINGYRDCQTGFLWWKRKVTEKEARQLFFDSRAYVWLRPRGSHVPDSLENLCILADRAVKAGVTHVFVSARDAGWLCPVEEKQ